MTHHKKITIFGAGISGLVAAINLAKSGFDVEVMERRSNVGGSPSWHPSVHQQHFDVDKTAQYIAVDIIPCFHPVSRHTVYFYNKTKVFNLPRKSYVCEKGPQHISIEYHLYTLAEQANVKFSFGQCFDVKDISSSKIKDPECIVATGLEQKPYRDLNINHSVISGFGASAATKSDPFISSYMGKYTNHEFAYVASSGDLIFALLFSRKGMHKNDLQAFRDQLQESEGLAFDNWQYSTGCIPLGKNLIKNGVVLAGTISGMIDPFFLNGISAAMISGKIAALYFSDREKAYEEFGRFTRNFFIKQKLQSISSHLPAKKYSFPLMALLNNQFKWVGVI